MASEDREDEVPESETVELSLGDGWWQQQQIDADGEARAHTLPYHRREDGDDAQEVDYLKSIGVHCATDEQGRIVEVTILTDKDSPPITEVLEKTRNLAHVQELSTAGWSDADESQLLNDTALQHLANWKELQRLDLGNRLNVSGEGFKQLLLVNPLPKLEEFSIHSLSHADLLLQGLSGAGRLRLLEIGPNDASDEGVSHLAGLPRLAKLVLQDNENLSGVGFRGVDGWVSLKELDLEGNLVSDAGVKSIASIVEVAKLFISSARVTDDGIASLPQLQQLNLLAVGDCAVTPKGLRSIAACPALDTLFICNTDLGDESLPILFGMESLRTVFAIGAKITAGGVAKHRGGSNLKIVL